MFAQDVIRKHGIVSDTLYRWEYKLDGMEVSEAKQLWELEAENAKLKKPLAETMLGKVALGYVLSKKC